MSPSVQHKPIIHGRDHCPGGADPIPCLMSGAGSYPSAVFAISGLLAYWRLGEPSGPWLDTSGVAPPADLALTGSGTAPTPDVPGALTTGDDGALEFNYDGISPTGGRYLVDSSTKDFALLNMTVAAWVKVKASGSSRRGVIVGNSNTSPSGGVHQVGWGLQVVYPSRKVRFTRGQPGGGGELYVETAGGLVAGDWNLLVGTYDHSKIRLYVNGVLVGETADTSGAWSGVDFVKIGTGGFTDGVPNDGWFYGTVDEAAVWTRALTQSEIDLLYMSGVGDGADAGSRVLVSDGQGGYQWGQANGNAIQDEAIVDRHVAAAADIAPTKLQHPGGTTTYLRADGTWAAPPAAPPYDPATATQAWMPLADSDGLLVLDSNDALIPTLITL